MIFVASLFGCAVVCDAHIIKCFPQQRYAAAHTWLDSSIHTHQHTYTHSQAPKKLCHHPTMPSPLPSSCSVSFLLLFYPPDTSTPTHTHIHTFSSPSSSYCSKQTLTYIHIYTSIMLSAATNLLSSTLDYLSGDDTEGGRSSPPLPVVCMSVCVCMCVCLSACQAPAQRGFISSLLIFHQFTYIHTHTHTHTHRRKW